MDNGAVDVEDVVFDVESVLPMSKTSFSTSKQDLDFGIPDPHPMDFTRCLHKLTGSVLHKRGPEVLSEYLT